MCGRGETFNKVIRDISTSIGRICAEPEKAQASISDNVIDRKSCQQTIMVRYGRSNGRSIGSGGGVGRFVSFGWTDSLCS